MAAASALHGGLVAGWLSVVSLLSVSEACIEAAWGTGYLDRDTALEAVTLASPRGTSSCTCCALCHNNRACASLSFNSGTKECLLHGTVAEYSTLTPDRSWLYFVMPGRSHHQQFCRYDSDCLTEGDFCRGRVCTELTSVTCRVIYETFGAGGRYGESVTMHAWLDNNPQRLRCRMTDDWPGFTGLFQNHIRSDLDRENVLSHDSSEVGDGDYSILSLVEEIRQLRPDPTYQLRIEARCDQDCGDDCFTQFSSIPRSQSALVSFPDDVTHNGTAPHFLFTGGIPLSVPYLASGDDVLSVKMTLSLDGEDGETNNLTVSLPLLRSDGCLWYTAVSLDIRE